MKMWATVHYIVTNSLRMFAMASSSHLSPLSSSLLTSPSYFDVTLVTPSNTPTDHKSLPILVSPTSKFYSILRSKTSKFCYIWWSPVTAH